MHFIPDDVYHIYNRGNDRNKIFFKPANYIYFLDKIRKEILPVADILCWSLMPNHYHLMVNARKEACEMKDQQSQQLSTRLGKLQSSYTQAINKQNSTRGSLFQHRAKAKSLCLKPHSFDLIPGMSTEQYLIDCMHYI